MSSRNAFAMQLERQENIKLDSKIHTNLKKYEQGTSDPPGASDPSGAYALAKGIDDLYNPHGFFGMTPAKWWTMRGMLKKAKSNSALENSIRNMIGSTEFDQLNGQLIQKLYLPFGVLIVMLIIAVIIIIVNAGKSQGMKTPHRFAYTGKNISKFQV